MDEDELYLSEFEEEDDEDESDPTSFAMALTHQGPPGEFRTPNRPGERQRAAVSVFQAGRQRKPAFTVSCNAKAMIHGKVRPDSSKSATLLVYEFKFRSYRGTRLKEANILFEFKRLLGETSGIKVAKVRPDGVFKMEKSEQTEGIGTNAGINVPVLQFIGVEAGVEHSTEKIAMYHTVLTGDNPQNMWGDYHRAHFTLSENKSRNDGIPSMLTVCILLERDDDQDFLCVPYVNVTPDFKTTVATLFSTREPDHPVLFSVDEGAFNLLDKDIKIDMSSLESTEWDKIWGCTMYNHDVEYGPPNKRDGRDVIRRLETSGVSWEALSDRDKSSLAYHDRDDRSRPTILHKIAESWESDEFSKLPRTTLQEIAVFLLDKKPAHVSESEDPVLTVALNYHNLEFIDFVITRRAGLLPGLLMQTGHMGMNSYGNDPIRVKSLVARATAESLVARDSRGNTPIHYALEYTLFLIPRRFNYVDIIEKLVKGAEPALKKVDVLFNKHEQSPYLFHLLGKEVRQNAAQQPVQAAQQATKDANPKSKGITKDGSIHTKEDANKPPVSNRAEHQSSDQADEMHTKINRPSAPRGIQHAARHQPEPESQHHIVPRGVATNVESDNALGLKPLDRKLTSTLDSERNSENKLSSQTINQGTSTPKRHTPEKLPWGEAELVSNEAREFLKCFFIRTRSDREAKDVLYGKIASDKNLFFDASHLRGKDVTDVVRLIEKVSKAGGFEDTLSYVRIPRLVSGPTTHTKPQQGPYGANEKRQLNPRPLDAGGRGRDTLVQVFDKLVAVKVKKILRLEVEDNGDEWAHTDTAIERAIKGHDMYSGEGPRDALEVEVWNWYKPDINLDIILWAAPTVQHIHLHWSGSQAVLYGWASEDGIPFLYRSSGMLKQVTLHAYQAATLLGEQLERPRSHAWIETMEKFRTALFDIHLQGIVGKPKKVKVALIDDGIDLDEFKTYEIAEYTGVSYYRGNGREDEPWWRSTDGHGTIMANMISRINPWIVLDVIKIQSSRSYIHGEGARSISPKSAAEAIEAAVVHDADIISMSWTITDLEYRMAQASSVSSGGDGENKSADESEMDLLRKAITNAVDGDRRLLICSAADDVRLDGDNTLPYSRARTQILRIGPTGPAADRDQGSNNSNSITYYVPGNQVAEEQRANSAKPVVYHNGSSVSTALAAGLASMIMYCARCVHSASSSEKYAHWADSLRDQSNMRKAFRNIGRYQEWEDSKIVPVWALFGDRCRQLNAAKTRERKAEVLEELVKSLCHDIPVP
ncbi:hypothetical protein BJY01DRAFT_237555 [Aspergillus pseudoustus]|uniref:Peptidase S8/S53 domain-containing protein n=1 Tax=Aspergillus pseudoustus TaxID=1810923 RepID=A0ABR4JDZ5_9EURO